MKNLNWKKLQLEGETREQIKRRYFWETVIFRTVIWTVVAVLLLLGLFSIIPGSALFEAYVRAFTFGIQIMSLAVVVTFFCIIGFYEAYRMPVKLRSYYGKDPLPLKHVLSIEAVAIPISIASFWFAIPSLNDAFSDLWNGPRTEVIAHSKFLYQDSTAIQWFSVTWGVELRPEDDPSRTIEVTTRSHSLYEDLLRVHGDAVTYLPRTKIAVSVD